MSERHAMSLVQLDMTARHTRNWNLITVVTLNPERDAVIKSAA
jgi:hypothetical protein